MIIIIIACVLIILVICNSFINEILKAVAYIVVYTVKALVWLCKRLYASKMDIGGVVSYAVISIILFVMLTSWFTHDPSDVEQKSVSDKYVNMVHTNMVVNEAIHEYQQEHLNIEWPYRCREQGKENYCDNHTSDKAFHTFSKPSYSDYAHKYSITYTNTSNTPDDVLRAFINDSVMVYGDKLSIDDFLINGLRTVDKEHVSYCALKREGIFYNIIVRITKSYTRISFMHSDYDNCKKPTHNLTISDGLITA